MLKILICFLFLSFLCGCTETKQVSDFKQIASVHKTVALLPSNPFFLLSDEERKKIGQENINESEQKLSFMVQQNMSKWFMKSQMKYKVSIQDIKVTNKLLFQSGMNFMQFKLLPKDEIAKKLHVDIVVFCNVILSKKYTDIEYEIASFVGFPLGSNFRVVLEAGVVDKTSSKILWQKNYMPTGKNHEDIFRILERMIKTAAADFPYKK